MQVKNCMCSHGFRHELRTFQLNTFQDIFGHLETRGEERPFELSNYGFLRQYIILMEKSYSTANVLHVYKLFNRICSFRGAYQFKLLSLVSYVSVNSKHDHSPPKGTFLMGKFPTPGEKKVQNPDPLGP